MKNKYNKLVRDNIPTIIKENGEEPIYHTLNDNEYWLALLKKDSEELQEVKDATSKDEVLKELGDKLELIRAMAEYQGFTLDDVIKKQIRRKKQAEDFKRDYF